MRTIAHISDIHFGKVNPQIAASLQTELNERKPSLIVASGDFTQRARRGQFRQAAAFLARLPRPQIVVPGNHDIPLYNVIARFFFPLRNYRRFISDDLHPMHRDEEIAVAGMNTARSFTLALRGFWKDGRISARQLDDLDRQMAGAMPGSTRIVVTHHPFISPPGGRRRDIVHGAHAALLQMERSQIDFCLAGHLHQGYCSDVREQHAGVKRSILSIQAGTATSTRTRARPNSYNWIIIDGDVVTIQIRAWNGTEFVDDDFIRFARTSGIWTRT